MVALPNKKGYYQSLITSARILLNQQKIHHDGKVASKEGVNGRRG
jgi:hypothetical protein